MRFDKTAICASRDKRIGDLPLRFREGASVANLVQALFTSDFWRSGIAIVRYIPRSFHVRQVDGDSFFSGSVSSHPTFIFSGIACRLSPLGGGKPRTCPHGHSTAAVERRDRTELGYRRVRCRTCKRRFHERTRMPYNRLQYSTDVVCLVVPWRFRDKLSLRDLAEMFLQQKLVATHEAVRDWEATRAPVLIEALRKKRPRAVRERW
jgi:hypothetical protein